MELARRDPAYLAEYALGLVPKPFHRAWQRICTEHKHVSIIAPTEFGKALDLDTPIPTPMPGRPWVRMGDLKVGDRVFGRGGEPRAVTYVSPIQEGRTCYEVVFKDGGSLVADRDHRWLAWSVHDRAEKRAPRTITTGEMLDKGLRYQQRWRWKIPLARPAQYPEADLPIHPYVLGLWLGNGHHGSARISFNSKDTDIIERAIDLVGGRAGEASRGTITVGLWPPSRSRARDGLSARLKSLGVFRNKHIPEAYLTGSTSQRRELLAGLLDTDGTVSTYGSKNLGRISYSSTSKPLALGVLELARSLGERAHFLEGRAKLRGRDMGPHFRVEFGASENPFFGKRKGSKVRLRCKAGEFRTIVEVHPVESRRVRCITVDGMDHTYLAGRDYTVTHNTATILLARSLWEIGNNSDLRIALISNTAEMPIEVLGRIKDNIEFNPLIAQVFPDLKPEMRGGRPTTWLHNKIRVQRSARVAFTQKEPSIQALGLGGRVSGARLDLVIMDDVVWWDNALTLGGRKKLKNWLLGVILGRMTAKGRIWFINNAWDEDDLIHWLEKERGWPVFRFRAGDPDCDWPEVWPPERLAKHRLDLGEIEFGRQMLAIPFGEATDFFSLTSARRCQDLCDDPEGYWTGEFDRGEFVWITVGMDIAASRRAGSALTTFFVLGLDKGGQIKHTLHIRAGRYVGADLLRELVQVHRMFRPNEWAVESNATQAHITELCTDTAILGAVGATQEEANEIRLRMHAHFTTEHNKNHEIWGVRAMRAGIDALTWRFPKGQQEVEMLFQEMRTYDPEAHTGDRLIGMWIASLRMKGKGQPLALSIRRGGSRR